MTTDNRNLDGVETPEPGTPWTIGKMEDAGAFIKRVVLVDMDNTLCDWEGQFEAMMAKNYPNVPLVPRSERKSWNHVEDYPEEHKEAATKVATLPGFYETMKANPGAIEAIKEMEAAGNEVFIVSSPDPNSYAQCSAEKYKWVSENLGESWLSKVILTRDKTTVQGHVLIDDKPVITGVVDKPQWVQIVYSQTYNSGTGKRELKNWADWKAALPAKVPLHMPNKETLYPNGINFSCVFPSFNQYEIVRKTLAGLAKQKIVSDFKFEVIIVDNNSTDDIDKIYRDYRDKLDLRLIQRRKLENTFSVPSARNMGILEAKYDYIVGMDSDVIFDEYALENLYKFLSSNDPSTPYVITAERYFVDTEKFTDDQILADFDTCKKFERILSKANYFKPRDNRFSHGNVLENVRNNVHPYAYFYGMHTAFPRKIWEAIGGYDEVYDGWWGYDDIEFAYSLMVNGGCIPVLLCGTEVYHQEPYGSGWVPLGGVVTKDGSANPRLNKAANPNWKRICDAIPGYAEWKKDHYERLAGDIITL
jgi:5'-nucleotidase